MARKTKFEARGLDELITALGNASENITKDIAIAAQKAANKCKSIIGKEISGILNAKQSDIKKQITTKRLRWAAAEVVLSSSKRPPLKAFKPSWGEGGVTVNMFKNGKTLQYKRGFMGPRPGVSAIKLGGHVWSREVTKGKFVATKGRYKGKMRHRLTIRKGVSPYAVFVKNNQILPATAQTMNFFRVELAERIRWLRIKRKL